MQFTVETKKFTSLVSSIVNVFQQSSMLSATGNDLLITANENNLTIESANQGMYVKAKLVAKVAKEGDFTVNSKYLLGLRLFGKEITFDQAKAGSRITFSCGKFNGKIDISQAGNKIVEQRPQEIKTDVQLPFAPFKKGMGLVLFTPNKATPVLPFNLITDSKSMILSTFDTTSATYFQTPCSDLKDMNVMLPAQFIAASFDKLGDKIDFGMTKKTIKLSSDNFEIYHPTKQQLNKFDVVRYYDQLTKQKPSLSFQCKASLWIEAIQTTASITAGLGISDNTITIKVDPKTKTATVDLSASIGEATSEFELADIKECENNTFFVSSLTFNEFLNNVHDDIISVTIYPQDNFKRVLIETNDISYLLPIAQKTV